MWRRGAIVCRRMAPMCQRRFGLTIGELQKELARLEPRDSQSESAGVRKLRDALLTLQQEADAKEKARQEERPEWEYYVVHAVGPDKVGMSAEVAATVSQWAADIEASRSTILAGDFSMMLHVKVRKDKVSELREALQKLDKIDAWLQPCEGEGGTGHGRNVAPGRRLIIISIQGQNSPGIVSGTTRFLASREIDIRNFASEMLPSPDGPVYSMKIVCDAPVEFSRADAETGVTAVGQVLGSQLRLEGFEAHFEQ